MASLPRTPTYSTKNRSLSILFFFIFFHAFLFYESQALHRQLCYFLVTLLVLHMLFFCVFASNYALFWGDQTSKNAFNRQLRYFMVVSGVHSSVVFNACVCVCVFSSHPFWTSSSLDVPAGVTQEEGRTGFLIHLPSAVRALIFVARRIQPFLSLVDREVEFCVLTN